MAARISIHDMNRIKLCEIFDSGNCSVHPRINVKFQKEFT